LRNGKSVSTLTSTTNNIYKNFEHYENQRRINFQDVNYKLMSSGGKQYPVLRKNRYSFLRSNGIYRKHINQKKNFGGEGF
jgi:hypothetical protein